MLFIEPWTKPINFNNVVIHFLDFIGIAREDNRNDLPGGVEMSPNIFQTQTRIEKIHFLSIIWHGFVLLLQTWRRRINSFRIHFFLSFGSRMSILTSLSYEVSLSTLLLSQLHAAVFWFIFDAETFKSVFKFVLGKKTNRSFLSNNCYDVWESIADTPKRLIISINEFFALSALDSKFSTFANEETKNRRNLELICMKSFDCYSREVNKLLLAFCSICLSRFTISIEAFSRSSRAKIEVFISALDRKKWSKV